MVEVKSATRLKEYHLQDVAIQAWVTEGAGRAARRARRRRHRHRLRLPRRRRLPGAAAGDPRRRPGAPADGAHPRVGARLQRAARRPAAGHQDGRPVPAPLRVPVYPLLRGAGGQAAAAPADDELDLAGACEPDAPIDITRGQPSTAAATEFLATLPYPRYYLDFETVQFAVPLWAGTQPFQQLRLPVVVPRRGRRRGELEHRRVPRRQRRRRPCAPPPRRCSRRSATRARSSSTTTSRSGAWWRWRACSPTWRRRSRRVTGRLVDLLRLTRDHYRHPALNGSYSLKAVLPDRRPRTRPRAARRRPGRPLGAGRLPRGDGARHAGGAPRGRCAARCSSTALSTPWRWYASPIVWARLRGARGPPPRDASGRPRRRDARRHRAGTRPAARAVHRQDAVAGERGGRPLLPGAHGQGALEAARRGRPAARRAGRVRRRPAARARLRHDRPVQGAAAVRRRAQRARVRGGVGARLGIITRTRPRILTFVYKGALDKVLEYSFGWEHKSEYGFNDDLMRTFGRRVFAFPLPGVACTLRESSATSATWRGRSTSCRRRRAARRARPHPGGDATR